MSVKVLAKDKIVQAHNLLNHLEPLSVCNVFGVQKLKRKIEAEIKFLNKSLRSNDLNEEHILSSNIGQLASLVEVATTISGVTAVLKSFDVGDGEKIIIDVVGENHCKWYKVILRNPKALHQLHIFGGRNGVRPLDKVAQDILDAAKANPVLFVPPKVCFYFVNGVSERLAKSLKGLGVEVKGQLKTAEELGLSPCDTADSSDEGVPEEPPQNPQGAKKGPKITSTEQNNDEPKQQMQSVPSQPLPVRSLPKQKECPTPSLNEPLESSPSKPLTSLSVGEFENGSSNLKSYTKVNLDVTCLIAYVSSTSNGGLNYVFKDKFLNEQAESERKNPVKNILNAYLKNKELIVCEEAAKHFQTILETIGGNEERKRGHELLQRCSVVPSHNIFKDSLQKGGRIKELSRLIFGTGQFMKAPTITSNTGFVRAAENQGVNLAILYHEPRALTERKEDTSKTRQI